MRKLILMMILLSSFIFAQNKELLVWFDTDSDSVANTTETISQGDTLSVDVYVSSEGEVSVTEISNFTMILQYGYPYTYAPNEYYTNTLTFLDVADTGLTSTPTWSALSDAYTKSWICSWADTSSTGIVADSCLFTLRFTGSSTLTGDQILGFPNLMDDNTISIDGYTNRFANVFLRSNGIPMSVRVSNLIITVE